MGKRTFFAAVFFTLFCGLSATYGVDDQNEKVGVLQKMDKAYNDFTAQQQKPKDVKTEVPDQPPPSNTQSKGKEKTREEMIVDISRNLENLDGIFKIIPALKSEKDPAGKTFYTYNGVSLDQMKKEDLLSLRNLVAQLGTRLRTERIQRQLETIARVQAFNNQAIGPRGVPAAPPAPPPVRMQAIGPRTMPAVPNPPSVPRVPPSVTSASGLPAAPPAPPPTRR